MSRSCRPKQAYAFVRGDVDALAQGNARSKMRRADDFAPLAMLELIYCASRPDCAAQVIRDRWFVDDSLREVHEVMETTVIILH